MSDKYWTLCVFARKVGRTPNDTLKKELRNLAALLSNVEMERKPDA
jgi:hypothetical protein